MATSQNTPQKNHSLQCKTPLRQQRKEKSKAFVPAPLGNHLIIASLDQRLRLARESSALQRVTPDETSSLDPIMPSNTMPISNEQTKQEKANQVIEEQPTIYRPPILDFKSENSNDQAEVTLPPVKRTQSVYDRWEHLLPQLVSPYLVYLGHTKGKRATFPRGKIEAQCGASDCERYHHQILALFPCEHESISVTFCECKNLPQVLISNGLFPATPTRPKLAFSIVLLKLYHTLFLRSADSVNSFSAALNDLYVWRGYSTVNNEGLPTFDPFRRSLGIAFLWYTNLIAFVEKDTENALGRAEAELKLRQRVGKVAKPNAPKDSIQASRWLRERCPACFGGSSYGRPAQEGADIHVAIDGNFNHRHMRCVRNCPEFFKPEFILSKAEVDAVGYRLDSMRQRRKPVKIQLVPDDAIDGCQAAHTAGSGSNVKTDMKRFDAGGLMGLVCRHDIPLFGANIDTAGEQQKYGVALIEHLMKELPPNASVLILYDVGCVLDRTLNKYDVLDDSIISRISFATSAMHAYAHEWACQLAYNPRMQEGYGLTDGEGVERLWSSMRHLIGVTRTCAGNRRIFLVDRQMKHLGDQSRLSLGDWITRRMEKSIKPQRNHASKGILKSGLSEGELHNEWMEQRRSQLSTRGFTTAEARRKIEHILGLEGEVEKIESSLLSAKRRKKGDKSTIQQQLALIKEEFNNELSDFYSSINIASKFPRLARFDKGFLMKMVIVCDLKVVIRKKVISSLFEWDRIDQAAGGRNAPIGTRMHQSARRSISKRQTTLGNLIRKFNTKCDELSGMKDPKWKIALPEQLPTDLSTMRKRQDELLQDPWLEDQTPPRWLADSQVRQGIRDQLKVQRCREEEKRLQIEAGNLVEWLKKELAILEVALTLSPQHEICHVLLERQYHIRELGLRWARCSLISRKAVESIVPARHLSQKQEAISEDSNIGTVKVTLVPEENADQDADELGDDPFPPVHEMDDDDDSDDEPSIPTRARFAATNTDESDDEPQILSSGVQTNDRPSRVAPRLEPSEFHTIRSHWSLSPNHQEQTSEELFSGLIHANLDVAGVDENIQDSISRAIMVGGDTKILFEPEAINLMRDPRERLNDLCMNPLAQLIQHKLSTYPPTAAFAADCAVFSTWLLPFLRGSPESLWTHNRHLKYWLKSTWILPIHRGDSEDGHWVMCIISFCRGEMYLFDSLANRTDFGDDFDDIALVITTLQHLAVEEGFPVLHPQPISWRAQSALLHPRQIGGIDCGVWVLAMITAALSGYTGTSLEHRQIAQFRNLLLRYILSLPPNVKP